MTSVSGDGVAGLLARLICVGSESLITAIGDTIDAVKALRYRLIG